MSRNFAPEMNARFVGCRVVARARDETKNRDVRLYALPDTFDSIGVNDGIDVWIASPAGNPFGVNVKQALEAMWQKGYGLLLHDYPFETERYVARGKPGGDKTPPPLPTPSPGPRERRRAILAPPGAPPEPPPTEPESTPRGRRRAAAP